MDRTAQMEAARNLAQEFKSGVNSRRRGGARGGDRDGLRSGGSTYGVGAGRCLNTPRSEFSRTPMTRPMPTNSRSALSNTDQNRPAKPIPASTKEAIIPVPVDPKLASWLTNSSQSQPLPVKSVPNVNATLGSNTSASEVTTDVAVAQAQSILEEPVRVTTQTQSHTSSAINKTHREKPKASDGPFEKATSAPKCNGLGKSIWSSESPAAVGTQDEGSGQGSVVDTDMSARASDILQGQQPVCITAAAYDGQIPRLLETDPTKDETQKTANTTGSKLQLPQQPKFGTLLWALQQLETGLELPDPQQVKAHGYRLNDNCPHIQSVAISKSDDVKSAISQDQNRETENNESSNSLVDETSCNCCKRSHPVIGLAASKYNTDVDGDVDISDMSTAARNRFAVNVILHDHSNHDCPVLLKTKMKYPLYFGANPATVNDEDNGLSVTVWEEPRHATPSIQQTSPQPQKRSGGRRGIMSSIWAD
ncbi:hypothetical protein LY78DRAFT_626407 [Colletotrichum sublineola]|nr:hypothetical protein LY78DRAFT_626407 [Colletotrichum sublineola]